LAQHIRLFLIFDAMTHPTAAAHFKFTLKMASMMLLLPAMATAAPTLNGLGATPAMGYR
jgi:hypothetical protein